MIRIVSLLLLIIPFTGTAQQTIRMHNLWHKPEVCIKFGTFFLFFTLKDMDKAMKLLPPREKKIWGDSTGLDTNAIYSTDLEPGGNMQYKNKLQPLIQNEIGAFLLIKGHAMIENHKLKKMSAVSAQIGPVVDLNGLPVVSVEIYDPENNSMIFSGTMWAEFYHMDLDFD